MINYVSNDEPMVDGETNKQRQEREERNADRAQRRAIEEEEEKRQIGPQP